MNVGSAIKACREARGVSQRRLADTVGCTSAYVSLIEREMRDPRVSMLKAIADALDVSLLELLTFASLKIGPARRRRTDRALNRGR